MASITQSQPPSQVSTFAALRYGNFRLYFGGQLVSLVGTWAQIVAQGWLVFHVTHSELWLGIVACAAGLPSLLISPFAGVWVDRMPRRRILLMTQTAFMILAFILAALTFGDVVQVWHIVILAFLTGIAGAVDAPARQAIIKDMVGYENITSGVALQSMTFNGARIIGPAAAGIMLAQFGPGWCFLVNGISFLAVLLSLFMMEVNSALPAISQTSPVTLLKEGIRFSRSHVSIWPLLLLSAVTCIFLVNLVTVLPAYADVVLHSPVDGLSALSTWQGIGAVVSALLMGYLSRRMGRGNVLLMTVTIMSLTAFGLARVSALFPASLLIGLFGFAMILFFIALNTTIQSQVPDQFRGRVLSLYTLTFMGLSPFGALAMGVIADRIGTPNALAFYAILNGVLSFTIFFHWPGVRRLS